MSKGSTNKKHFKDLAKQYKQITQDHITIAEEMTSVKEVQLESYGAVIAKKITGYGDTATCKLCATSLTCASCYWITKTSKGCNQSENEETYMAICDAKNAQELLAAFKNRSEHMYMFLKKKKKNESD
jgi:hypothetical protein